MSQRNIDDDLELDALCAKLERYEAVIEAARAWKSKVWLRRKRIGSAMGASEDALAKAVQALEAAEKHAND